MDTTPENYLKELLNCVIAINKHFTSKNDWNNQNKLEFTQGLFRRREASILIPYKSVKHRVQFECHEQIVLDGYIRLAKQLLEKPEDPLAIFVLRVLYEIGFDKIDALFAQEISHEEKQEFKLIDSLSDLLGITGDEYRENFLALLNEEREILNSNIRKLFEEAEVILKNNSEIKLSLLKRIRRYINSQLKEFSRKITLPVILKGKTNFEPLNITFSHLLHGNPIAIKVAIDPEFSQMHGNWVLATIWNTGLNILIRTKNVITDQSLQKRVEELLQYAEPVWEELQKRRLLR